MKVRTTINATLIGLALVALSQVAAPEQARRADDVAVLRPTGPLDADSCAGCHGEVLDHAALHGPLAVDACAACHVERSAAEHTYDLAREGAALCTFCHDVDLDAAVVHEPVGQGDCLACHDPHGGPTRALLRAPSLDALCATCHEDVTGGRSHLHGPVAVGACSACHLPHASPHPGLLTAADGALCTSCHTSIRTEMEAHRFPHAAAQDQCLGCHDAHASDHLMFLREETGPLCLSCHDAIRHTVETATHPHAAVTTDGACLNCHAAHGSDFPSVLRDDMMTLCFECHDREIETATGTLANMKLVIKSGTSLHGPVAQSDCAACHMLHGGDNFRMLVKEYPAEFYAPFAEERYALCFSCHDKQLVYDERTTALTDFRNGDLNLHYVHVNRKTKGRSCRACHETHASSNALHVRDFVPFGDGGWSLPIGFDRTDTGGSCAPGCHVPYDYDRDAPVTYPEKAEPALWPKEPG